MRAQQFLPAALSITAMLNLRVGLGLTLLAAKHAAKNADCWRDGKAHANQRTIEIKKRANAAGSCNDGEASGLEHALDFGERRAVAGEVLDHAKTHDAVEGIVGGGNFFDVGDLK